MRSFTLTIAPLLEYRSHPFNQADTHSDKDGDSGEFDQLAKTKLLRQSGEPQ